VVECAPVGEGEHWEALSTSPRLVTALDSILRKGAWEININTRECPTRFFYAPVVFPEADANANVGKSAPRGRAGEGGDQTGQGAAAVDETTDTGSACAHCTGAHPTVSEGGKCTCGGRCKQSAAQPRLVELMSWKDERKAFGQGADQRVPPSRWQSVNRRRFRGKGWHIDIGPAFDGGWPRTLDGYVR
jgi:hypothetical protein